MFSHEKSQLGKTGSGIIKKHQNKYIKRKKGSNQVFTKCIILIHLSKKLVASFHKNTYCPVILLFYSNTMNPDRYARRSGHLC